MKPSGIIPEARESVLTSRYRLRIIHRQKQTPACLGVYGPSVCQPCWFQPCTDVFQMSRCPELTHHIGYVVFYILVILKVHMHICIGFKILSRLCRF